MSTITNTIILLVDKPSELQYNIIAIHELASLEDKCTETSVSQTWINIEAYQIANAGCLVICLDIIHVGSKVRRKDGIGGYWNASNSLISEWVLFDFHVKHSVNLINLVCKCQYVATIDLKFPHFRNGFVDFMLNIRLI